MIVSDFVAGEKRIKRNDRKCKHQQKKGKELKRDRKCNNQIMEGHMHESKNNLSLQMNTKRL